MNKSNPTAFHYEVIGEGFVLHKRDKIIAGFDGLEVTERFMIWVVDTLNRNHAEFVKDRTEQTIREMGF